jgi:hypothetical protein
MPASTAQDGGSVQIRPVSGRLPPLGLTHPVSTASVGLWMNSSARRRSRPLAPWVGTQGSGARRTILGDVVFAQGLPEAQRQSHCVRFARLWHQALALAGWFRRMHWAGLPSMTLAFDFVFIPVTLSQTYC